MPRRPSRKPPLPHSAAPPASRREFLAFLGAAGAVPLFGALPVHAQAPPQAAPAPPAAAPSDEDAANAADARSLTEIVQRRYGARLTEAQLYEIRKDIEGGVAAGRALRAVALQNAAEPVTIFRALPLEA